MHTVALFVTLTALVASASASVPLPACADCGVHPVLQWNWKPTYSLVGKHHGWHLEPLSGPPLQPGEVETHPYPVLHDFEVFVSLPHRAMQVCGRDEHGKRFIRKYPLGVGRLRNSGETKYRDIAEAAPGHELTSKGQSNSHMMLNVRRADGFYVQASKHGNPFNRVVMAPYRGKSDWEWMAARWGADPHSRDYSGLPHLRLNYPFPTYAFHGPVTKSADAGLFLKRGFVSGGCSRMRPRDTAELWVLAITAATHGSFKGGLKQMPLSYYGGKRSSLPTWAACGGDEYGVAHMHSPDTFAPGEFYDSLATHSDTYGVNEAQWYPPMWSNAYYNNMAIDDERPKSTFFKNGACSGMCVQPGARLDALERRMGGRKLCEMTKDEIARDAGKCPETPDAFCCRRLRMPAKVDAAGTPVEGDGEHDDGDEHEHEHDDVSFDTNSHFGFDFEQSSEW